MLVVPSRPPAARAGAGAADDPRAPDVLRTNARKKWLLLAAVLALGLLMQVLPFLVMDRRDRIFPRLVFWLLEMPTLLVALSVAHEWSTKRRLRTSRSLLLSVGLAATIGAASALLSHEIVVRFFGAEALPGPPGKPVPLYGMVLFGIMSGLFTAGFWAFAFVYPFALEDARLRAVESEKLRLETETLRTAAELARLRSQLEPHFLLNTLNAIAGLVTLDPREARRLLALLGELLGDSLDDEADRTLERELAWLRGYGAILEARFAGALSFEWDVDETLHDALVPRLFLQPLIENAVTHGALRARSTGDPSRRGRVVVRIQPKTHEDGRRWLDCAIEDDGPGFDEKNVRPRGIGLGAARRRLELWSSDATLRFDVSEAGTRALVTLPEGQKS